MKAVTFKLPPWPADGLHGARRQLMRWWLGLPEPLRSRTWPTAFACLMILALLLGFHAVVSSAVKQGELLRMSAATRAEAVWRCNALRNASARASCIEQLNEAQAEAAAAPPPPNTATLAQVGR